MKWERPISIHFVPQSWFFCSASTPKNGWARTLDQTQEFWLVGRGHTQNNFKNQGKTLLWPLKVGFYAMKTHNLRKCFEIICVQNVGKNVIWSPWEGGRPIPSLNILGYQKSFNIFYMFVPFFVILKQVWYSA